MNQDIQSYLQDLDPQDKEICEILAQTIDRGLPEAEGKVWHGHPVWFLGGNPIVGFSKQKAGVRLMFWSGASFDEPLLEHSKSGKFKDASIFYNHKSEILVEDIARWLNKSNSIQWDYKNLVKRKGKLERLR